MLSTIAFTFHMTVFCVKQKYLSHTCIHAHTLNAHTHNKKTITPPQKKKKKKKERKKAHKGLIAFGL